MQKILVRVIVFSKTVAPMTSECVKIECNYSLEKNKYNIGVTEVWLKNL